MNRVPRHPFQKPSTQLIDSPEGQVEQFPADAPGALAKVLTVTTVTGGQRITFREQTSTSRDNATPTDADNPLEGEAMVPSAFGTVSVNDYVTTYPIPGRDELLARPPGAIPFVQYSEDAGAGSATMFLANRAGLASPQRVSGQIMISFSLAVSGVANPNAILLFGLCAWSEANPLIPPFDQVPSPFWCSIGGSKWIGATRDFIQVVGTLNVQQRLVLDMGITDPVVWPAYDWSSPPAFGTGVNLVSFNIIPVSGNSFG